MPLREMYEGWPFFRKLVDFMQMTLAKSDLRIAEHYTSLVSDPAIRERLWQRISGEVAEGRWRKLSGAHLVALVRAGARLVDGELVGRNEEKDAA